MTTPTAKRNVHSIDEDSDKDRSVGGGSSVHGVVSLIDSSDEEEAGEAVLSPARKKSRVVVGVEAATPPLSARSQRCAIHSFTVFPF